MTFRQMELFVAVCDNKSISKTSEAYYISQQGISKMIRDLEGELSCKLLNRTKNGVTPTESGLYFLGECQAILEKKNELLLNISSEKEISYETIYIGMAYGMIAALPNRLILDFEKNHELIKISYADQTDLQLEYSLQNGEYDCCITAGILDSDNYSSDILFSEKIYLCLPKTHALFYKKDIKMEDLVFQHFAMLSTQFHIRHNFVASCKRAGFEPIIDISSSDFNSLREVAIHNNLLFVVPEHTSIINDEKFKYYEFPDKDFEWNVYFTRKVNKPMSTNMNLFYKHIRDSIAKEQKIKEKKRNI